ncbi:glycosyltransferase [Neolewinella sp.]|uniref:glycosyltransferase n=1 Tax=Neolewinella sp. TaxID=2993543 RepID=UPI003B529125
MNSIKTRIRNSMAQGGYGFYRLLEEHSQRNGGYFEFKLLDKNYSFNSIVRNTPILVMGDRRLEYPWIKYNHNESVLKETVEVSYIQPATQQTEKIITKISYIKATTSQLVVLVSFGRLSSIPNEDVEKYYSKTLQALKQVGNIFIIVSAPESISSDWGQIASDNLAIYSFIQQDKILPYCDFMINHGGLNSISECRKHLVPVLVLPFYRKADHFSNAAKVIFHKIGVSADLRKTSVDSLVQLVEFMVAHHIQLADNISVLNRIVFDDTYIPKPVTCGKFVKALLD